MLDFSMTQMLIGLGLQYVIVAVVLGVLGAIPLLFFGSSDALVSTLRLLRARFVD